MTAKPTKNMEKKGRAAKGSKTFWTQERIEPALRAHYGNIAAAALMLQDNYGVPCSRHSLWRHVEASDYLKGVITQVRSTTIELVDYRILQKADLENNLQAQLAYANAHGKHLGWGKTTTDVTQAIGASLSVKVLGLTKRDLRAL